MSNLCNHTGQQFQESCDLSSNPHNPQAHMHRSDPARCSTLNPIQYFPTGRSFLPLHVLVCTVSPQDWLLCSILSSMASSLAPHTRWHPAEHPRSTSLCKESNFCRLLECFNQGVITPRPQHVRGVWNLHFPAAFPCPAAKNCVLGLSVCACEHDNLLYVPPPHDVPSSSLLRRDPLRAAQLVGNFQGEQR